MSSPLQLRNRRGDTATLTLQGGQVLSWRPAGETEQLYLSPASTPAPGRAVRGGVPVCFPQFATRGPLAKHGFARLHRWRLLEQREEGEAAVARLALAASDVPGAWEHGFALELEVRLGPGSLQIRLDAANTGSAPFEFTCALHTYLAVDDVRAAAVEGLQSLWYEDAWDGGARKQETATALDPSAGLDRVYLGVPSTLRVIEPGRPPRSVEQQGFIDTVIWNPGPELVATLPDMPARDWTRMLCVEAAVASRPLRLAPGQAWSGLQRIEILPC